MPTPKQRYAAALLDIVRRFDNLETETVERALQLLIEMRNRLQLELTTAETFNAFRLQQLTIAIDGLILQYESQMVGLANTAVRTGARLGALSVIEPLQAAGLSAGFFQPTPAQLNVLLDFSADLIRGISGEIRAMINTQIRMAALGERSTISAMQAVNEKLGIPSGRQAARGIAYRGERIIRTEVSRVFNLSTHSQQLETAKSVPGLKKQWIATGDKRTRLTHLIAHGQIVGIDELFRVGKSDMEYPLDPSAPPEETINCILPNNEVVAPDIMAASRAWYSGPALEIRTSAGKNLAVTPNHPILTPFGFVPAKLLNEGDYIVGTCRSQEIASAINPNDDYMPTAIEEVWGSLLVSGESGRFARSAMPHDFHDDGGFMDGDVNVVLADSKLRGYVGYAPPVEHFDKLLFGGGLVLESFLSRLSLDNEFAFWNTSPPNGLVGRIGEFESFFGRQNSHSNDISISDTSRFYPGVKQVAAEGRAGHSRLFSQLLFSFASKIAFQKMLKAANIYSPGSDFYATVGQSTPYGGDGYPIVFSDTFDRMSGLVHLDNIVGIRKFNFCDHVYDLQTLSQLYISNGIFVHNCRCREITIHPSIGRIGGPLGARIGKEIKRRELA
jgi:hypothetical protein